MKILFLGNKPTSRSDYLQTPLVQALRRSSQEQTSDVSPISSTVSVPNPSVTAQKPFVKPPFSVSRLPSSDVYQRSRAGHPPSALVATHFPEI